MWSLAAVEQESVFFPPTYPERPTAVYFFFLWELGMQPMGFQKATHLENYILVFQNSCGIWP